MSAYTLHVGDCMAILPTLPKGSVQCCVTSPPYFGLRDYGQDGQLGLESTPDEYVAKLVAVFREVRRVLRDDGTVWLNLGDSYAGYHGNRNAEVPTSATNGWTNGTNENARTSTANRGGLKPKDLIGIPWRVAFALQADGWYLRQDIIWSKPNPMPESVRDRPTKAHEYLFLLSKSARYYYDAEAVKEGSTGQQGAAADFRRATKDHVIPHQSVAQHRIDRNSTIYNGKRNRRSVWTVSTQPYGGAHFATFPPKLIEPCILAGSAVGDTVLDPFGGSGTTAGVAIEHGRKAILCELSEEYAKFVPDRINSITDALTQGRMF